MRNVSAQFMLFISCATCLHEDILDCAQHVCTIKRFTAHRAQVPRPHLPHPQDPQVSHLPHLRLSHVYLMRNMK